MATQNEEIQLRLKAPMIALERIANGRYLPEIFARTALQELRKILRLTKGTKRVKNAS